MAGTYFGYAERNASDEINWSQVGKNLTDMLSSESKIREEKKAAIDKATREYGETLANAPQGEHQGVNQWWLTYANNAEQARLMQDRLLKSGQLKQKDYMVMRQNIVDGTKNATNLVKEYQAEYSDKMERYKNGDSQALEQFLMAEAEGFANFNNSELYINPTDFTVNVAKKEKQIVDGKEVYVMSKNPNDFTTVNAMRNRIKGKFDKLDVDKTLQGGVNVLGKDIESLVVQVSNTAQGGLIKSINDITKKKDFGVEANEAISLFERSESTYLDSIMAQPTNISSILTEFVVSDPTTKEGYTYTWDAKKAGGSVILLKNDSAGRPVPEFTEEQKKVAKNALRERFRIMLDREIELKATPQAQLQERRAKTAAEYGQEELEAEAENYGRNLAKLLTGTQDQVNQGLSYFTGMDVDMRRDKKGVYINTKKGKVPYEFGKGGANDLASSIVSGANPNGLPEDLIMKYVRKFTAGKNVNLDAVGKGVIRQQAEENPLTSFGKHIETTISASDIPAGSTKMSAAKILTEKLSGLGVEVKSSMMKPRMVYAVNENGEESPMFDIEMNPKGAVDALKKWIKSHPKGKDQTEKNDFVSKLIKSGVVKGGKTASEGAGELD
jgi:vacuolar-type H+-ATPase subunit H